MWLSWIVEGRLAASGMLFPGDSVQLLEDGIAAVVSLTTSSPFPDGPPAGLSHLHVPVPDMTAPRDEDLLRAVRFIREEVGGGHAVLVHCGAGLGRTGTVVAAYLVSEGSAPDEAIRHVRAIRPGSIETSEQAAAVRRFPETWRESLV